MISRRLSRRVIITPIISVNMLRNTPGLLLSLGTAVLFTALAVLPNISRAGDFRQHVLAATAIDPNVVIEELQTGLSDSGFVVSLIRDDRQTAAANGGSATFRYVEFSASRSSDGRNISIILLILDQDREEGDLEILRQYFMQTYAGYATNGLLKLSDSGFVIWNEWSSMTGNYTTDTLDDELANWKDSYIEVD